MILCRTLSHDTVRIHFILVAQHRSNQNREPQDFYGLNTFAPLQSLLRFLWQEHVCSLTKFVKISMAWTRFCSLKSLLRFLWQEHVCAGLLLDKICFVVSDDPEAISKWILLQLANWGEAEERQVEEIKRSLEKLGKEFSRFLRVCISECRYGP
jgi:hypothetical protein